MLHVSQGCTRLDRTSRIPLDFGRKFQNRMPKQCLSTLHRPLPALKEDTALLHSFEILKSQQDPTSKQHRSDRSEGCKRSMRCSRIMQEFLNDCHDPRRTSCANYTCSNLCDLKLQACRARDDFSTIHLSRPYPTPTNPLHTSAAARVLTCSTCALDTGETSASFT